MGVWAGIKHALNSTLGTSDFKPLDKLISEKIDGVRTLGASDAVIFAVGDGSSSGDSSVALFSFFSKVNGSMRCMGTIDAGRTSYSSNARLYVIDTNGVGGGSAIIDTQTTADVSFDFQIKKGKTYTVYVSAGINQTTHAYNVRLGASVIDASMVQEI